MKKLVSLLVSLVLVAGLVGCSSETETAETTPTPEATEEVSATQTFSAEYEMLGTTSSGNPKNDTFIFEGTTDENGIITELYFDVIRNKGLEGEYSKTDIYGYEMNVSDAIITETEEGFKLDSLTSKGYSEEFAEGGLQFLNNATIENLTPETTFGELTVTDYTGTQLSPEDAIISYKGLAVEAGVEELSADTLVSDLVDLHGLYDGTTFVAGENRVSFEGIGGGRSYGEQIQAIADHILANEMTLEEVYDMFKTVNQSGSEIAERDVVSGATIQFVGDFQRMVYVAMHGELFQGVVTHTEVDGNKKVEVVTQGYGGEIETHVTFDAEGNIVEIAVRDDNESGDYGAKLTVEGSDYINALIDGQADVASVDVVSGSTKTSDALKLAVQYAQDYISTLE